MIIRNIDSTEIDLLAKLAANQVSFKDMYLSWLNDGITKLEWCFIAEDNNEFVGRIIYGVFDDELEILDINIQHINNDDIGHELLYESLKKMRSKGFAKVGCNLYSDKDNFQKYVEMLINQGFVITQKKKSFVWERSSYQCTMQHNTEVGGGRLSFRSLRELGSYECYIDAIRQVTVGTLDKDDIECIKEYGDEQAAAKYFNQLKDIDFNNDWWKLAYSHDEFIGLVIPQRFNDTVGAINYIGVVPEKRGNGYVNDLLVEGVRILSENNIKKVIADIDEENYPLENALYKNGFKLDCSMLVLKLN
ncbi:acetyltransferase (GNAT) family protein [Clostridium tepidiprofundi DSM 19306]|uniref:Acetyltransferase (GNAT) family protein n=1 Tax=Clostridium tepidiprofundi DSM 19306 TaxID=1121338 RepID=A0A151AW35_9CLOT|nr:GNAT family N-acetyltransferase [Clostridium tepidiprofundi]KYH31772.1 acetyltransferase (GNAT) family protein [Clostridium tepidiprofundi DSM 19306]